MARGGIRVMCAPLTERTQAQLAAFLVAFIEERRWIEAPGGDPKQSTASPTNRSAWRADLIAKPVPAGGRALSAEDLYKRVAPSVFKVSTCVVRLTDTRCAFIGSAVAIDPKYLVTNAHVSEVSELLWIEGEGRRLEAEVVSVEPNTDRAVLKIVANDQELVPVAGVRDFASLRVGEPAFAIGSPVGLDDTLSSGVVSALRPRFQLVMGGVSDCVQTSAPISPGSSGGGLFDQRGNLIGITTEAVKPELAQNLNFAIAADAFFRP